MLDGEFVAKNLHGDAGEEDFRAPMRPHTLCSCSIYLCLCPEWAGLASGRGACGAWAFTTRWGILGASSVHCGAMPSSVVSEWEGLYPDGVGSQALRTSAAWMFDDHSALALLLPFPPPAPPAPHPHFFLLPLTTPPAPPSAQKVEPIVGDGTCVTLLPLGGVSASALQKKVLAESKKMYVSSAVQEAAPAGPHGRVAVGEDKSILVRLLL